MKRLDDSILLPGDIVFATSAGFASKGIRLAMASDISHVMLYISNYSIVHSTTEAVQAENTQGLFFEETIPVYVMRHKRRLTSNQILHITDYARKIIGSEYSKLEAARAWFGNGRRFSAKQFCSRLAAQSYAQANLQLVQNVNYCTPDVLFNSSDLYEVNYAVVSVSNAEYQSWKGVRGPTDLSMLPLLKILHAIRILDPTVQNLTGIGRFLAEHPEHDLFVNNLLKSSGYLNSYHDDFDEHPWRWSILEMEKQANKKMLKVYCEATVRGVPGANNHFTRSLAGFKASQRANNRASFISLIDLYEKLSSMHAVRHDVACMWLKRHGHK